MNDTKKFSKDRRLLTPADYKSVFDQVAFKASTKDFLLLACENPQHTPRIGIIVAKKHLRFAVQRNQTKRIIRESFRAQSDLPPLDMVILLRSKQDKRKNAQIHADLMLLWRRLKKLYAQRQL